MKKYFAVALIASMFAATGCTTMGDQSLATADQASVDRYIVNGKTTMAEVQAVFGDTKTKEGSPDGAMWYYSAVNHRIVNATIKTLAVNFNTKGIVTSHRYAESGPTASTIN